MRAWARAAGLANASAGASTWAYGDADETAWWGDVWATRVTESSYASQACEHGLASAERLRELAAAWRRWAAHPDAWFAMTHGELLARVA